MNEQHKTFFENLEKENEMIILFLCEGGSRGWGTYTPTSDSDFRGIFIYKKHRLLQVQQPQPVISNFVVEVEQKESN